MKGKTVSTQSGSRPTAAEKAAADKAKREAAERDAAEKAAAAEREKAQADEDAQLLNEMAQASGKVVLTPEELDAMVQERLAAAVAANDAAAQAGAQVIQVPTMSEGVVSSVTIVERSISKAHPVTGTITETYTGGSQIDAPVASGPIVVDVEHRED